MSPNNSFEKSVNNSNLSFTIEALNPGKPLIIAFGGRMGALGLPPFEFFNLTKDLNINKIYIRDLHQAWYHLGLEGISRNISETIQFLLSKKKEIAAKKIVTAGNSMGGYAAILFGTIIEADTILAFAPQTFIGKCKRFFYRDSRWTDKIKIVHEIGEKKYFDLRCMLKKYEVKPNINIFYNYHHRLDRVHAKNIRDFGIHHPFRVPDAGHHIVKYLKSTGKLKHLLLHNLR